VLLQVTGKLDGADSGLDISVNELDQHLHKVLEVRDTCRTALAVETHT
jgi:hypothetical protein